MNFDHGESRHFCDDPACPVPVWQLSSRLCFRTSASPRVCASTRTRMHAHAGRLPPSLPLCLSASLPLSLYPSAAEARAPDRLTVLPVLYSPDDPNPPFGCGSHVRGIATYCHNANYYVTSVKHGYIRIHIHMHIHWMACARCKALAARLVSGVKNWQAGRQAGWLAGLVGWTQGCLQLRLTANICYKVVLYIR